MPSNKTDGLQRLVIPVAAVALGTLAAETAKAIHSVMDQGTIKRGFLCKKLRLVLAWTDAGAGDALELFFAGGDISDAEYTTALKQFAYPQDPDDRTNQIASQAMLETIWSETMTILTPEHDVVNRSISLGKGIPITTATGMRILVFNPSASSPLVTGSEVVGHIVLHGVWLDDTVV